MLKQRTSTELFSGSTTKEIEMEFTNQQLQNFKKYVRVQLSGRYNMFDPRARAATGMSEDEYTFVMINYSALKEASKKKGS
jgi:hypothetical protein